MNFDQIEKLIKLANNNPNDNEANSAARRVCKLLAGHKFANTPTQPKQPPVSTPNASAGPRTASYSTPYGPSDWFHKMWNDEKTRQQYREGFWNDVFYDEVIKEEPIKKEEPKEEPNYNYGSKRQEEFFNQRRRPGSEGTVFDRAEDWYLFNPVERIYKNKKTNVEISELDYIKRFGINIDI